ncbi:LysR substrate-binding domain-containing protein [Oceanibium sediminis]|uniref:LysR substrate-binding domain-containing protein n=1 Tax=Oceanibium sediminis TaxID=2026339 RepID=UPI000DD30978|nr:LysR substrate-binding domain-containing protein [Oceanibium sediminis]
MVRRHYGLPPMTTLVAFEVAARHASFKRAAAELNVTPGAVSHQIRALEQELGVPLFERVHRGVALSEAGLELFGVMRNSLSGIAGTVERIRQQGQDRALVVGATTAVAALWLTPRITGFWREHPEVGINQILSDSRERTGPAADLRIVYGRDKNSKHQYHKLFQDRLVPLAAPGFVAATPKPDLTALAGLPLIHLNAEDQNWTTWSSWFAEFGYHGPLARGARVNNYMIALQAAQDGAGVVLGWQRLVSPLLAVGALEVLGSYSMAAPNSFHIERAEGPAEHPSAGVFQRWLLDSVSTLR